MAKRHAPPKLPLSPGDGNGYVIKCVPPSGREVWFLKGYKGKLSFASEQHPEEALVATTVKGIQVVLDWILSPSYPQDKGTRDLCQWSILRYEDGHIVRGELAPLRPKPAAPVAPKRVSRRVRFSDGDFDI